MMLKENLEKAKRKLYPAYDAVRSGMGRFAARWFSLPLLVLFSFGCFAAVTYLAGYRLGGLNVSNWVYQFYLCDYSVGFCSRLLVGAVITMFTDVVSTDLMDAIINTSVILSLILQAMAAGVILRIAMKRGSLLCCGLVLVFLLSPMAVTGNMRMPGQLDVYLLVLFLLWLACYRTPAVYVVSPLVCAVSMAIHYEFFLMFLPPMLVLLLYRSVTWEKKRARVLSAVSFAFCLAVSASLLVWFVFFANRHLHLTESEFYYGMLRRFRTDPVTRSSNIYRMGTPIYKEYFDAHLFGHADFTENLFGEEAYSFAYDSVWGYIRSMLIIAKSLGQSDWSKELVPFLPVALLFCVIWVLCMVKAKGKPGERFVYFCCAVQMLVLIPDMIASSDLWRFISAAFISQFSVFFVIYYDQGSVLNRLLRR